MIRLLLAEDQVLLRDAIQSLLQLSNHIDIVASTGNGSEALHLRLRSTLTSHYWISRCRASRAFKWQNS